MPMTLAGRVSITGTRTAAIAFAAVSFVACAGQPFAAPIQDEPVCADFTLGAGQEIMEGALEYPIQVRFLEGKTQLQRVLLHGRRPSDTKPPKSFLPDDNVELTVEWAQCSNQWAPRPASVRPPSAHERQSDDANKYECGDAAVYKTETLVIKKQKPDSHVVHFVAPKDKGGCWKSDVPTPEAPKPTATPSAEPAAPSAQPSAEPAASAVPSASAKAAPPSK
jgi:hypothetical protein